jgi:hypothetical protein
MYEADYTALLAEAPCDACPLRTRCAQGAACRAFASYVHGGSRWRSVSREPSAAIFAQVFPRTRVPRRRRPKVAKAPVTGRNRRTLEAYSTPHGASPTQ